MVKAVVTLRVCFENCDEKCSVNIDPVGFSTGSYTGDNTASVGANLWIHLYHDP